MTEALSVSLLLCLVVAFSAACDNGQMFGVPEHVNVGVEVRREVSNKANPSLKIFANGFNLNGTDENDVSLVFACPCYLGRAGFGSDLASVVEVSGQQVFSVKLLPNASYDIKERRLKSGSTKSYHFSPLK